MMLRLKTISQLIKESYPPGAANDPNAPYNQRGETKHETEEIDGSVWNVEGDKELPVKIKYTYNNAGKEKCITEYSFKYVNDADKELASIHADEDVRNEIKNYLGKCSFE